MSVAPEKKVEVTAVKLPIIIGCAFEGQNYEIEPKNFAELEVFILEDSDLEPKSYAITYTKKEKEFNLKN